LGENAPNNIFTVINNLKTMKRDDKDDGTVVGHQSLTDVEGDE